MNELLGLDHEEVEQLLDRLSHPHSTYDAASEMAEDDMGIAVRMIRDLRVRLAQAEHERDAARAALREIREAADMRDYSEWKIMHIRAICARALGEEGA